LHKLQASKPVAGQTTAPHKRKHGDEDMDDVSVAQGEEDGLRKKRSRQDVYDAELGQDNKDGNGQENDRDTGKTTPTRTRNPSPQILRRTSGTPIQGVEIQIPSRPATPIAVRTEAIGGNSAAAAARSPLIPQTETAAGYITAKGSVPAIPASSVIRTPPLLASDTPAPSAPREKEAQDINEDEWAAFEADLLHSNTNGTSSRPIIEAPADAVISAPAMTAEELAAKSAEEERERRRAAADIELEDEKEEAARALETEFEDMEELETRVRRLKERREALRHQQVTPPATSVAASAAGKGDSGHPSTGKENAEENMNEDDEDEDDEEEEEDADDWAGFRFRG
jgi:zinc finger protein 830